MAGILANDPTEGALVSRTFLENLNAAIDLRRYQNERHIPQTGDDTQYKKDFDTHMHFIKELEQVRINVLAGIRVHHIPGNVFEPYKTTMKPNTYGPLPNRVPAPDTESGAASPFKDEVLSLDTFTTHTLARLGALYGFKVHVESAWRHYAEGTSSLLLAGLSLNFALCHVSEGMERFIVRQKDICNRMPVPFYHSACPDTGFGGIMRCLFLNDCKAHDEAEPEQKNDLARTMYRSATHLFMPALGAYLDHWIWQHQQEAQGLNRSSEFFPFGTKLPVPGSPDLGATNLAGSVSLEYLYRWKSFLSKSMIREYHRLATLDSNPSRPRDCFEVLDHLSSALKNSLLGDKISYFPGINLDLVLEAHRLGNRMWKPHQKATQVGEATIASIETFVGLIESGSPPGAMLKA